MSCIPSTRARRAIVAAALTVIAASAQAVVGSTLPRLEFRTLDGAAVSLQAREGRLVLEADGATTRPTAVLVHFFQPDCPQCRAQAPTLDALRRRFEPSGVVVLGVAHRGTVDEARKFARESAVGYRLLTTPPGSLRELSSGDAMFIADAAGTVTFSQPGYGRGDEELWSEALRAVLAGARPERTTAARTALRAGDAFPTIELPELVGGGTASLALRDGGFVFRGRDGAEARPKAVLAFFSRFCAFSREEMAALQRIHESLAPRGTLVFVVAMQEDADASRRWVREHGITYPVLQGFGSEIGARYAYG